MNWLARLKGNVLDDSVKPTKTTKPTERVFVGFVGTPPEPIQENIGRTPDETHPDEVRAHTVLRYPVLIADIARLALFSNRHLHLDDAQMLVERLALRDEQRDDRRVCLECAHMSGSPKARRCSQWRKTGMQAPPIPGELVGMLQRCHGYSAGVAAGAGVQARAPASTSSEALHADETAGAL